MQQKTKIQADAGKQQAGDCDDQNAAVSPNATEFCDNSIDDNCNGQIDENCDLDGDGFSYVFDCNDLNPNVNPNAQEICDNAIDENCNGQADEGCDFDFLAAVRK